jgi:hypothetical protein
MNKNYKAILESDYYKNIDKIFSPYFQEINEKRFFSGKIDIIIPYYKIKQELFINCILSLKH